MTQDELNNIIAQANTGIHKPATKIKSYTEFIGARFLLKSMLNLNKTFLKTKTAVFKMYKKDFNKSDNAKKLEQLFVVRNMDVCFKYYLDEIAALKNQISIYRDYLRHPEDFDLAEGTN